MTSKKKLQRLFSIFLCLVLCLTLVPATAFTAEGLIEQDEVLVEEYKDDYLAEENDGPEETTAEDSDIILDQYDENEISEFEEFIIDNEESISEEDDTDYETVAMMVEVFDETDQPEVIANGTCGYNGNNLTWTLNGDGQLTISGSGSMASYNDKRSRAPWYSYASKIKSVIIENGVSTIGAYAFDSCRQIERVEMSGDLKNIGERAFSDCPMLSDVVFSEGLKSIGEEAFFRCASLESIVVPSTCTSIGLYAMNFCQNLKTATILGNPSLDSGIFQSCTNLESATVPQPANSMFQNCEKLTNVTFTKTNYTTIPHSTFKNCTSLTGFTIPASVTIIYPQAFQGCTNITGLAVDSDNKNYCSVDGIVYDKAKTELIVCPPGKEGIISIPESVYKISDYAFETCDKITEVRIPKNVSYLGTRAFAGCSNLEKVNLPEKISDIQIATFDKCTSLKEITFPENIKNITDYAFRRTGLQRIIVPNTVTYISPTAFDYCTNIETVYFYGDEDVWSSLISRSENQYLLNASLNYLVTMPAKAPTCTEPGYTESQMWSGTNAYVEGKEPTVIAPTGHNWTRYIYDDNATCTKNGTKTSTCVWCGLTDSVEEPNTKKEHSFNTEEWKMDDDTHWHECRNCDARIDEKSHTEKKKITPAVYNRYGTYTIYCSECDRKSGPYYIPAIKSINISKNEFVYSGSDVDLEITIRDENGAIIGPEHYEVSYPSGRKSVGEHEVVVKLTGLYDEDLSRTFTINPPTNSVTAITNVANGIKISWNKVAVADRYAVYRGTNHQGWDYIATVKGSSTLTYTDTSKLKNGNKYTYCVVPQKTVNGKVYYGEKGTSKNIIRLSAPWNIKLTNPSAGKMKVTWSKSDVPTGYVIQYSLKSNFSNYSSVKFKNTKLIDSKVISKLKKGKTYYVRMYAYKTVDGKEINSAWSTKKKIKIKK